MRHLGVLMAALIASAILSGLPALAATKRDRPRDLNAYSLRYWARDTLRIGQIVSAQTPYGELTCWSRGSGRRFCSLR